MRFQTFLHETQIIFEKTHPDIPTDNQDGTCYQDALNYMMKHGLAGDKTYLLCHGLVTGQGAIEGIVYNHAWIEKGNKVIDQTVPIELPKQVYYAIGNIDKKTVYKYTYEEMAKKVGKFKTYGPWEPKLLKNKY